MSARQSTKVACVCGNCQVVFYVPRCSVARGEGRYCSSKCYNADKVVSLIDRFFRYVGRKMDNGCIPWAGTRNDYGYGVIGSGVRPARMLQATHVSYEYFVGQIPEGLHILHRCDNPPCINPVHLFVGTAAVNMADKVAKGRQRQGESIPWSALTEQMVRWARLRYATGTTTYDELAAMCGVTKGAIRLAVRRETWKHVL